MVTFSSSVQPFSVRANQLNKWMFFLIISTVQTSDPAGLGILAGLYLGLASFHWIDEHRLPDIPSFSHSSYFWDC